MEIIDLKHKKIRGKKLGMFNSGTKKRIMLISKFKIGSELPILYKRKKENKNL